MGSVIDYVECNRCHGEMMTDYCYKSNEEVKMCRKCGYFYKSTLNLDENNKPILDENNNWTYTITENKNSCGSYLINFKSTGIGQAGIIPENTKEDEVLNIFNLEIEDIDLDESYVYFFNPETKEGKMIFGHKEPPSSQEQIEEWEKEKQNIF